MGWGSQNDFNHDAFEQGIRGQVRQLRGSYDYLLANQRRLNLKQVYWFTWKDVDGQLRLLRLDRPLPRRPGFKPKPAWHAFVALTGGNARP